MKGFEAEVFLLYLELNHGPRGVFVVLAEKLMGQSFYYCIGILE